KKDLSVIFKLRKIIKSFEPDIIHSWGSMASVYLSMVRLFTPNSAFINGTIADAYPGSLLDRLYVRTRLTAPFSKVILANSKAGIKAYKVSPHKAVCIYNGIDLTRFKNLKPAQQVEQQLLGRAKGNSFIAAMIGAFEDRKDYDTLIKAAVKLCTSNSRAIFFLIGEGSLLESIREQVPERFIGNQIHFLGSRHDIESILQIVDAGLLITPCEGISNSIMEYMASGKPVIASREGGTPELVIDGETGYLVDQKASEQIIEKMQLLMSDPAMAKEMGRKGQQRIHDHFDIAKMTGSYIQLYHQHKRQKGKVPNRRMFPFLKSTSY
ncbi:MAG: glycosyltransferase, partial [Chitinophagaceae bacterium]|nr:glycosyltransferase [Chitinophagaceae bacterium]